jgi:hypothetical protein
MDYRDVPLCRPSPIHGSMRTPRGSRYPGGVMFTRMGLSSNCKDGSSMRARLPITFVKFSRTAEVFSMIGKGELVIIEE